MSVVYFSVPTIQIPMFFINYFIIIYCIRIKHIHPKDHMTDLVDKLNKLTKQTENESKFNIGYLTKIKIDFYYY